MSDKIISIIGASEEDVLNWLKNYIISTLSISENEFSEIDQLDHIGMDSVEITIMAGMIEEQYDIEMNLSNIVENPTAVKLAKYISLKLASKANNGDNNV